MNLGQKIQSLIALILSLFEYHVLARNLLPNNNDIRTTYYSTVKGPNFNGTLHEAIGYSKYEGDLFLYETFTGIPYCPQNINDAVAGRTKYANRCNNYCPEIDTSFSFKYKDGMVNQLKFGRKDTVISKNLKKAIASMFQINMDRVIYPSELHDRLETTVNGMCAVSYFVWNSSADEYRVRKVIHTETCQGREELLFAQRYYIDCPDCLNHRNVKSSIVYDYFIVNGWLSRSESRSLFYIQVGNQYELHTEMHSVLIIDEILPSYRASFMFWERFYGLEDPTEGEDLRFLWKWEEGHIEKKNLKGHMIFERTIDYYTNYRDRMQNDLIKVSYVKREIIVNKVHNFLKENTDLNNATGWSRLKQMLMDCDLSQIRDITYLLINDNMDLYIFQRGLATAGTRDSLQALINFWEDGRLSSMRFAMLLKMFQETDYPTLDLLNYMKKFAFEKEEGLEKDLFLHHSVYLSMGEVARGLFMRTKDRIWFDDPLVNEKNEFAAWIRKKYQMSSQWQKTILYIKVMGNSGFPEFFYDLEELILDVENEFIFRVEGIHALRLIKDYANRHVQRLLMRTFMNFNDAQEIRMLAFTYLMHTMPGKSTLELILTHLHHEANKEVAQFAFSTMQSLSLSTIPCVSTFAKDISRVINLVEVKKMYGKPNSSYVHSSIGDKKTWSSMSYDSLTLYNNYTAYPVHWVSSVELVLSRNWYQYFFQIGYTLLRSDQPSNRELLISIRYKQVDLGFLLIDKNCFELLLEKGYCHTIKELLNELKMTYSYGANIKWRSMVSTPTGVPLTFSAKVSGLIADWFSLQNKTDKLESSFFVNLGYNHLEKIFNSNVTYEFMTFK